MPGRSRVDSTSQVDPDVGWSLIQATQVIEYLRGFVGARRGDRPLSR